MWGVLFVWLFMSSLVLAEQVDLVSETSTHDEEALGTLQPAIRPGQIIGVAGPVGIDHLESIAEVARVPFLSSRLRVEECRSLLNSKHTINLCMILSCYRI